jgi:hypothetical protein
VVTAAPTQGELTFGAVAELLRREPDVEAGTGFGRNPGLRTGRRIFAMLVRDELVVKLPAERCEALVSAGDARTLEIGRRSMREWVCFAEPDEDRWLALATEARAFVSGFSARGS